MIYPEEPEGLDYVEESIWPELGAWAVAAIVLAGLVLLPWALVLVWSL